MSSNSTSETVKAVEPSSELDEQIWSVASFKRNEASGLTYHEAARLVDELTAKDVAGLCIITDEAAARILSGLQR